MREVEEELSLYYIRPAIHELKKTDYLVVGPLAYLVILSC